MTALVALDSSTILALDVSGMPYLVGEMTLWLAIAFGAGLLLGFIVSLIFTSKRTSVTEEVVGGLTTTAVNPRNAEAPAGMAGPSVSGPSVSGPSVSGRRAPAPDLVERQGPTQAFAAPGAAVAAEAYEQPQAFAAPNPVPVRATPAPSTPAPSAPAAKAPVSIPTGRHAHAAPEPEPETAPRPVIATPPQPPRPAQAPIQAPKIQPAAPAAAQPAFTAPIPSTARQTPPPLVPARRPVPQTPAPAPQAPAASAVSDPATGSIPHVSAPTTGSMPQVSVAPVTTPTAPHHPTGPFPVVQADPGRHSQPPSGLFGASRDSGSDDDELLARIRSALHKPQS